MKATVLAMIFRGGEVLAPAGKTELQAGDVVDVLVEDADAHDLFGVIAGQRSLRAR